MADRLTMLNAALAELGEEQLYFADGTAAADFASGVLTDPEDDLQTRCAAVYPQVRAQLLNAYPWSWLAKRRRLNEAPLQAGESRQSWPLQYRYLNPDPITASIRAVYDEGGSGGVEAGRLQTLQKYRLLARVDGWTLEGDYVYADFRPAWCHFQGEVAEERWPQLFENAVIQALAARLSMSIKEDLPTTRFYEQMAERSLNDAKRTDSQSQPSQRVQHFDWEEARFITHGSNYRV